MTTSSSVDNEVSSDFYYSSIALIVGVPAIGDFLFGLDIGVTSYAISLWNTNNNASLTGLLVAAPSTGALLASFVVFRCTSSNTTSTSIGRKQELQLAGALYLLGAGLCLVSGLLSTPSLSLLLVARWIYGSGIAFGLHGATTFMGEILPSSVRGSLMSLNEVSIVSGILCGYLVGYYYTTATATTSSSWALLYVPAVVLASCMLWLSTMYLEESARWLALQGRAEEARKAYHFVWKPSSVQEEENEEPTWLTEASNNNNNDDASTTNITTTTQGGYNLLCHVRHIPALRAGWGLVAFLQLTGQPTVLAYAAPLLQHAVGLSASSAVFVAIFKICMTLVALSCVEHVGRKTLLYTGCTAMWMGLVVLTATTTTDDADHENNNDDDKTSSSQLVRLIAMLIYIGGYQIGFGTMVWLVSSEIFSAAIRGPAVAVAVQINFGLHALVEFLVPHLGGNSRMLFGVFSVMTALSIVFLYYCVPETKGLTLEEIERQLLVLQSSSSSSSRMMQSSSRNSTTDNHGEHEPILASHDA